MTKNNAEILIKKAGAANEQEQQFPMLVWSDINEQTEIYLINNDHSVKAVNLSQTGNFLTLQKQIAEILGEADVLKRAYSGDELIYPIDPIEFQDDHIVWEPLFANITEALAHKPSYSIDTNEALIEELQANFRADVAASSLISAYDSIINYLAHLGHDLSVNSIGIDGLLCDNEIFCRRLIKHLNETYPIHFV